MPSRPDLISVLTVLVVLAVPSLALPAEEITPESAILRAEAYYWLGFADPYSAKAFQRGLDCITAARADPSLDPGDARKLAALEQDLQAQLKITKDKFYGVYPLVRVLGPVLVGTVGPPGIYDTSGKSDVTAAATAADKLAANVIAEWKAHPQLHAVLRVVPDDDREPFNQVLHQLSRNPRFVVHHPAELAEFPDLDRVIQEGNSDAATVAGRDALLEKLGVRHLLVVTIRKRGDLAAEGLHFYGVEGRLYQRGTRDVVRSIGAKAIALDRVRTSNHVVLAQFVFLLLAVATGFLLRRPIGGGWLGGFSLVLVASGFLVARALALILVPLLTSAAPAPGASAAGAFWWPAVSGVAIVLGPVAVIRLVLPRLASMSGFQSPAGNLGLVGGASGLGSAAFLVGPLAFLEGSLAASQVVPVAVACWSLGYLFGASLDSLGKIPAWALGMAVVLAAFAGTAFFRAEPAWLWSAAAIGAVPAALMAAGFGKRTLAGTAPTTAESAGSALELPSGGDLTRDPSYQRLSDFAEARNRLRGVGDGQTRWLGLWGAAGVGKTATARALLAEAAERIGSGTIVLRGTCPPESETPSPPYQPFREALAGYFSIDLHADRSAQLSKLDSALRGAVSSVLPIASILFPADEREREAVSSQREISACVRHSLRSLLAETPVLLMIDDLHAADSGTLEILQELRTRFPPDGQAPLAVLLTSRDPEIYEVLGIPENALELGEPDAAGRTLILSNGLGIEPASAEHIVDQVGTSTEERGSLVWLLQVVAHLARLQAFARGPEGLQLKGEFADGNALPIPDHLNDILRAQFLSHPQYRKVLECAACIGRTFPLTVLADGLELSRLDLLDLLREIETETGLIHDVMEDDDFFAFRSPLVLEVVRRELRVKGHGPTSHDVPQIIREYHARVAQAIEQRIGGVGAEVFELARNYYAAGASHSAAGRDWCLRAAVAARTSYDLDGARRYAEMARECASVSGGMELVDDEILVIDCDLAFLGATDPIVAAEAGLAYLSDRREAPLPVLRAITRTCYVAGDHESTARLGQDIVERAGTPEEKAAGHHFVGLGKRRLSSEPEIARREMQTAIGILEADSEQSPPVRRLRAQIENSLAETYAYGSEDDRASALRHFEAAVALRENREIGDLAGEARTQGGLGRLFYFAPEPDLDRAREHFRKNLAICEEIGEQKGQCLMHSFLGRCDRDEGNWEPALEHYRESYRLAEAHLDRLLAAAGRLQCLGKLGGPTTELDATGQELAALTSESDVPPFAWQDIRLALGSTGSAREKDWWKTLTTRADAVVEAAG